MFYFIVSNIESGLFPTISVIISSIQTPTHLVITKPSQTCYSYLRPPASGQLHTENSYTRPEQPLMHRIKPIYQA